MKKKTYSVDAVLIGGGGEGGKKGGVEGNTFIFLLAYLQILINNMGALLITEKDKKSLDGFD